MAENFQKRSLFFFEKLSIQKRIDLTIRVRYHKFYHQEMVKVKDVKAAKPAKKVRAKVSKVSIQQPTHSLPHSPSTRSNTATVRDNPTILDANEQKTFKMWISEIKQIQGLIICKCGLYVQMKANCSQGLQETIFVKEFPVFYETMRIHPILGSRVSKIPLIFLTVGTSKATETLNGEKLRKKYSTMKSYINNALTPIYKRY